MKRRILVFLSIALAMVVYYDPLSSFILRSRASAPLYQKSVKKPLTQEPVAALSWFPKGKSTATTTKTKSIVKKPAAKKPLTQEPVAVLPWFPRGQSTATTTKTKSVIKKPTAKKPLTQEPVAVLPWFSRGQSTSTTTKTKSVVKKPAAKKPLTQEPIAALPWFPRGKSTTTTAKTKPVVKKSSAKKPSTQESVAALPWYSRGQSTTTTTAKTNKSIPDTRRPNPYPIPKRIDLGHIEGKGVGYDTGYTKLSVILGPEYRVGHHVTLLDLRGVVFDDGKLAANAGFIGRFLSKSFCEVFGWNVFYDFRQGSHGNFNQISGGFEILNKRWEVHANASAPVGRRKHAKTCVFNDYIGPYREVCNQNEIAEYVFDGNVGYYFVNSKNFQLYAAAGPYYLTGPLNTSAVGGKAVLRPQFGDIASVELSVSHDRLFNTIYQVNVVLTLPLYKLSPALKNKRGPCGMATRQVYQPIDRDMVLYKKCCCHNNF